MASPNADAPFATLPDAEHNTLEPDTIYQTSALEEDLDPSDRRSPIEEPPIDFDLALKLLKQVIQLFTESQARSEDRQTFQSGIRALVRTWVGELAAARTENTALRAEMSAVRAENNTLRAEMTAVQTENANTRAHLADLEANVTTLIARLKVINTLYNLMGCRKLTELSTSI